jgi:hypothetical protein
VKRPYPKFAFEREQYAKLLKNGWVECETKRDEWFRFYDASAQAIPEKHCRYTFSKKFIKGTNLLSVMQGRYSKHEGAKNCPAAPDNSDVEVTIAHENYEKLQELKSALQTMEISCGGAAK